MTEDEAKAIFHTVRRTEARVQRVELVVWLIVAIIVGVLLRGAIG